MSGAAPVEDHARTQGLRAAAHLAEHRGRLVTKDDLLDAVWPGVFVGDAVLKVAVREIRAALDDDAKEPRIIQTVHRRGYRFVADVEVGRCAERASRCPPLRAARLLPRAAGADRGRHPGPGRWWGAPPPSRGCATISRSP